MTDLSSLSTDLRRDFCAMPLALQVLPEALQSKDAAVRVLSSDTTNIQASRKSLFELCGQAFAHDNVDDYAAVERCRTLVEKHVGSTRSVPVLFSSFQTPRAGTWFASDEIIVVQEGLTECFRDKVIIHELIHAAQGELLIWNEEDLNWAQNQLTSFDGTLSIFDEIIDDADVILLEAVTEMQARMITKEDLGYTDHNRIDISGYDTYIEFVKGLLGHYNQEAVAPALCMTGRQRIEHFARFMPDSAHSCAKLMLQAHRL